MEPTNIIVDPRSPPGHEREKGNGEIGGLSPNTKRVPKKSLNQEFFDLVPDGWFKEYLKFMQKVNNEMPLPFHFLSAGVILGNVLGHDHYTHLDLTVKVWPNISAMLISPAGLCRRSEGSRLAVKIGNLSQKVFVMRGKATPEGLVDALIDQTNPAGQGNVILYNDELATLMDKRDYMRPLIPMLTDYICSTPGSRVERTRSRGMIQIPKVNLSVLFSTAPEWFITNIPPEARHGGLTSRMFTCYLTSREVKSIRLFPTKNERDFVEQGYSHLGMELIHIKNQFPLGWISPSDPAMEQDIFNWYHDNESRDWTQFDAGMVSRRPAQVLRLCVLFAAAAKQPQFDMDMFERAVKIYDWYEKTMQDFDRDLNESDRLTSTGEKRIMKVLKDKGGSAPHSEVMQKCLSYFRDGGVGALKKAVEILEEQGKIELVRHQGKDWPPREWRLK